MSIYYRREENRDRITIEGFHLSCASRNLVNILPEGFSFEEYVEAFKKYYPHIWEDIVSFCETKRRNRERRYKKNLRTVRDIKPVELLRKHSKIRRDKRCVLTQEERDALKVELEAKARKKLQERADKRIANMVYVQEVCPGYVTEMIKAYFDVRRRDSLNVNARFLIIQEASQFRCDETIAFLEEVNACDKNDDLRLMAFYALQKLGEHPWLARKRDGKQGQSAIKPIDVIKNSTVLLSLLYENQELLYQRFDVFLSHSSKDVNELLRLKAHLNSQNKVVYIDWVNDKEMLNRANQNGDTWNALEERMRQSEILLFVMTDNSIQSPCTEREVNYFKQMNKKILIYQPTEITLPLPEYLKDCEYCKLEDGLPKF